MYQISVKMSILWLVESTAVVELFTEFTKRPFKNVRTNVLSWLRKQLPFFSSRISCCYWQATRHSLYNAITRMLMCHTSRQRAL